MSNFRKTLENCGLCDLGHQGDFFTWSNCHEDITFTKERLDQALVSTEWGAYYNYTEVELLAVKNLDHWPILVSCSNYNF